MLTRRATFLVPTSATDMSATSSTGSGGVERSWGAQLTADVIEDLVNSIGWEAVFEHVVAPAVQRTRARLANRVRSTFRRTKTEVAPVVPDTSPESSALVGAKATDTTFVMGREEYRQRVIAALAAEAFAAWQREILAKSRLEEDEVPAELIRAVSLVLEGSTSMLNKGELAAVMDFLEEARLDARSYEISQVSKSGKPL